MNGNRVYLIGALAAAGAFLLFLLLRSLWETGSQKLNARLKNENADEPTGILRRPRPTDWMGRFDRAFENLILHTGLELKPDQAIGWMILIGGALATGAYFVKDEVWFCAVAFFLGVGLVLGSFFFYRGQYLVKIQDQLPDAIYLLSRSLRAGLSLEQSLELLGNEGIQPLASEFKRCHAQIKLGLPISTALDNMAQELQMLDLNALVSTVSVFLSTGGNLPMLLDRLAASARDRANMRTYFRSATATARVAIIPVALAVPVILIAYIVWEPDYVSSFLETTNGRILMAGGVITEIIGLTWIYRLLRFEY
ncbi:MAG TPA: type II secretion system F family protein [Gemmataceae bacterium]|nr:type II secretion system F family protein [Gemmataceae bacterium]